MPEKSNIWRDCVDGYYDWVKEHLEEVGSHDRRRQAALCLQPTAGLNVHPKPA